MLTAYPGRIRDINFARTDLGEICHRVVSTTDLSELCCKSYDLPDSLIPALPSYELMDRPTPCTSSPMTESIRQEALLCGGGGGAYDGADGGVCHGPECTGSQGA